MQGFLRRGGGSKEVKKIRGRLIQRSELILLLIFLLMAMAALIWGAKHRIEDTLNYYLLGHSGNEYIGAHGPGTGVKQYSVLEHAERISDNFEKSADSMTGIERNWQ